MTQAKSKLSGFTNANAAGGTGGKSMAGKAVNKGKAVGKGGAKGSVAGKAASKGGSNKGAKY